MLIVFRKDTGDIVRLLPESQSIDSFFYHYPASFKDMLDSIQIEPTNVELEYKTDNFIIRGNKLMRRSNQEIQEMEIYGRVLTEEERLIDKLKPTLEEVEDAKLTIKILTQLQEVM